MRQFYLFVIVFFSALSAFATHERAGEITYRHIEGYTYEVTILTYTYAPSPADRPELEIHWGDNTFSIIQRTDSTNLNALIRKNTYVGLHTYSGAGTFFISMEDPNRNAGIINIPNSVNIPFYIETKLVINPYLGNNNSVQLLNPPLDQGCVSKLYIHNPGAYDPDGDSIAYNLTICRGQDGLPIPGYTLPETSDSFSIDSVSGNLIWDKPIQQGEYNVAFFVEEWRNGQMIGYVTRDLQIQIGSCNNNPPEILAPYDTCMTAGDTLNFEVTAFDSDGNYIILTGFGGPFIVNPSPAYISPNPGTGEGTATTNFTWETLCLHVRKNPYSAFFKAQDFDNEVSLTAYHTTQIMVNGPPPKNLEANSIGTSIFLDWEPSSCANSVGYNIYRKKDFYGFNPGYCETGVPEYTGYTLIESIDKSQSEYIDNNEGNGLVHGISYCYMITEFYGDGAESFASEEVCASLKKDMPIITNVSINYTSSNKGSIYVAWSKPTEIDFEQWPGPFEYHLYRKEGRPDADFEIAMVYYDLNDTIFIDSNINLNLNTLDYKYRYYLDFYSGNPGEDYTRIGTSPSVPSTYLNIEPSDQKLILSWNDEVPWLNDTFFIYKKDFGLSSFDSIGYSLTTTYIDSNLINGKEYCYYIYCKGHYSLPGLINPIINFSQESCSRPIDNVPPCVPELKVETDCDNYTNELLITYPTECVDEEIIYYIYYSYEIDDSFILLDSTYSNSYLVELDNNSIVGCFAVTSLDSLRNESAFSNKVCIELDECDIIWFPDIITPNGDTFNEIFRAYNINSVEELNIIIFNRWGSIVFESTDPYFTWNGIDQDSGRECSDGVYFFVANLTERTLGGSKKRSIKSSLTILR